jgi:hypothetical protein
VEDLERKAEREAREVTRGRQWSTPFKTLTGVATAIAIVVGVLILIVFVVQSFV